MPKHTCRNCGKEYDQHLETRSDPDICPHCGEKQWDPSKFKLSSE